MGEGRRRAARRVCVGAAAVFAGLALAVPVGAQDEAPATRPDVHRGAASALVASVEVDRDALLPVDDLFRFIALDGSSVYETDLQTARASLLFPGNGLILGPNLACGTFGAQFPPPFKPVLDACTAYDYPLSVRADATVPDRTTTGALALGAPTDPVSGEAVAARAHADADGASSYAAMEELRVLGLPAFGTFSLLPLEQLDLDPSILTIESATSRTDQRLDEGVLVVDAEAALSGVKLVGGLVRIGSIRSVSRVSDDAAGTRTADASIELSGVTVGGIPAQITEDGLVLGAPAGGPLQQQMQNALSGLLEALGVRISLLDSEETLDDGKGQAVASAGGLLIEVAADAEGLPTIPGPLGDLDPNGTYVGSLQLGSTAAAGGATTFPVDDSSFGGSLPATAGVLPDAGSSSGVAPGTAVNLAPAPVATPPAAAPRPPQELVRVLTDPFGGRLGLLYLSCVFAALGLCLMPRLTFSARLPGPGS